MSPDEWTAQMRLSGLPDSHHRIQLNSGQERKLPIGWGIAAVIVLSALVWAAIFFKL